MKYEAIVAGISSGGMNALKIIFSLLPADFRLPVIIVQHVGANSDNAWIKMLNEKSNLILKEADEKEKIKAGHVYFAPANYHLLVEKDKTFSLSNDEKVNFARPSIDVLFESASDAFGKNLIGIIFTGSNNDGAKGLKYIKDNGGLVIVQDPATAESPYMPGAAIDSARPHHILPLNEIIKLLIKLDKKI
jgi:two-component system, chemotaxis family, protein-glutamate methylesterase/glutaminase